MKKLIVIFLILLFSFPIAAQQKRTITFDDLVSWKRLADPNISPDGSMILFTITTYDKILNSGNSDIYLVSVKGGDVKQLTTFPKTDNTPRWLPDGKGFTFISTRDGSPQLYRMGINGGNAVKVTDLSSDIANSSVSKDGLYYLFTSSVYPDCPDDKSNKEKSAAVEKSKVKAKIYTTLPIRIWDHFLDGTRSHLFIVPSSGGTPVDLTPGEYDTPPVDLTGTQDYDIAPDNSEAVFVRNTDPVIAVSTNNDVFTIPLTNGRPSGEPLRISTSKGNDNQPVYSPDGKFILFRSMMRAGFEADKYTLMLYDRTTKQLSALTDSIDRSANETIWSPDGSTVYFTAHDEGYFSVYAVSVKTKKIEQITRKIYVTALEITPDGKSLVFLRSSVQAPAELFSLELKTKKLSKLTAVNDDAVAKLALNPLEEFRFKGAGDTPVHGFLLKPPFFDPQKKYPMVYLVHGGPQGAWEDMTHYRWNPQMFASPGFVVVMVNPRGSTGYGQKFTDEISGDWGGKVFEDLMKGVEYVASAYPFIDKEKIGAAGASYGGYMMNWIQGHNDKRIFKVLVSHDGVFNTTSAYGSTEELWFNEWEFSGTPYDNKELYEKYSPHNYVKNFKTPMLVIHSQNDYRLDVSEGYQLFTALQKMNVPSKFLYFPDENHFVAKPQNSELWHTTVLDWLRQYLNQ